MRLAPGLLALLVALSIWIPQTAEAGPPMALGSPATLSGTVNPGNVTDPPLSWQLNQDISEFVFRYKITGGSGVDDVVYVSIVETDGELWPGFLMGEGWEYCDCALDAGTYTIEVEADVLASGPLTFEIGFYRVPQPPVDFSGHIPANLDPGSRYSDFGVRFPSNGTYQLTLGVTSGSYEFFVDGEKAQNVTETTELAVELETASFHILTVNAGTAGVGEDVAWYVQIRGQPKLEVRIIDSCPVLNPESGESVCVTGAEATASDGSNPPISYSWSATPSGGWEFNSTTSQWVEWTAPAGATDFTLTVNASAPGYVSDTDSLKVKVVPEFPPAALPFVVLVVLALVLFARRSRR